MNYNIDFEATALDGAKILDIQGNWRRRRCICIPIDNEAGTVTTPDNLKGAVADVRRVFIHLTAFAQQKVERGLTHRVKPNFSREELAGMTHEQRQAIPWIGTLTPWSKPDGGSGSDW